MDLPGGHYTLNGHIKHTDNTAIIILAAGESRRLGFPKQLAPFGNTNLLQHTLNQAVATGLPVYLVLGAHAREIIANISLNQQVTTLLNREWEEGMAASLRCGISALPVSTAFALCCVADQPFIHTRLLLDMMDQVAATGMPIIACAYAGTFGVPILIHQKFFAEILQLQGDSGAKK